MTGYELAPKQLETAAQVMEAARASAARLRASRVKPRRIEINVEPPKSKGVLDYSIWPDWVNEFVHGAPSSNVIEVPFPVERPYVVHKIYPRIDDIIRIVAAFYEKEVDDLISFRRTWPIVRPRQMACYLCKTMTIRSLPEIGRKMGDRDHTTILHAVRKIERLRDTDDRTADEIQLLRIRISDDMAKRNKAIG
jgi:hypothetical protein